MADMPEKIAAWRIAPSRANGWVHGGWSEHHDHKTTVYVRGDRIADLERQLAEARAAKVKPLVWYEVDDTGGDWISAFTGSVSYTVKKLETWDEYYDETGLRHLFVVDVSAHGHERLAETYRTEEAAKAAAQDHHEAHILSALEPARSPSVEEAAPEMTEDEAKRRLLAGDRIVFSMDGDEAWFTDGDRAFCSNVVISLRRQGFLTRKVDEDCDRGHCWDEASPALRALEETQP